MLDNDSFTVLRNRELSLRASLRESVVHKLTNTSRKR